MKTRVFRDSFKFILLLGILTLGFGSYSLIANAAMAVASIDLSPEIVISSIDNEKFLPAVAYNSVHDEYLVVWQNKWPGNRDIYAQRLSSSGELLSWFAVAPGPGSDSYDRAQPSVAYDPVNDRYLIVFIYDIFGNGSDYDIGGRFIPWAGPDPTLTEFLICIWNSSQWNPVVTFALAQQEFLVTWTNTPSGQPSYISAARVDHNTGDLLDDFTVSSGTENRINPDVAYNLARNEYLVVWDKVGGNHDIYGVRLSGNGSALGTGEFAIAGWPDNEETPTVAACHGADQYLVGWQSLVGPPTNYDVYARYVAGDGVPGTVFLVDGTTAPEVAIDAACLHDGQEYLLAWQTMYATGYYGIWGRLVHPVGLEDSFLFVQPGTTADRLEPAIAGSRVNFLTTWVHDRNGTVYQDIRGRVVFLQRLFLPMITR
ncbi:MAG TPA: hypothetical protein VFF78_07265 [Anaerolineaceae bacterium]|nr:hypothetical protein [Anaerolineaceae bacterium]